MTVAATLTVDCCCEQRTELRDVYSCLTTLLHECAHSEPILRREPGKALGISGHDAKWKALYRELVSAFVDEVKACEARG